VSVVEALLIIQYSVLVARSGYRVHRKCSGIKGSLYKVMKTFVSRSCVNAVTGAGCTSVDIGVNANLELVDKFYSSGYMLSVYGDANAVVETRIQIGQNEFRQLVPLLTNKDISIKTNKMISGSASKRDWPSLTIHGTP